MADLTPPNTTGVVLSPSASFGKSEGFPLERELLLPKLTLGVTGRELFTATEEPLDILNS